MIYSVYLIHFNELNTGMFASSFGHEVTQIHSNNGMFGILCHRHHI
jgi:hypothetical protein